MTTRRSPYASLDRTESLYARRRRPEPQQAQAGPTARESLSGTLQALDGALQVFQGFLLRDAAEEASRDAKARAALIERRARAEAALNLEADFRTRSAGVARFAAAGVRTTSGTPSLVFQQTADTTQRENLELVAAADEQARRLRRAGRRQEKGLKLQGLGAIISGGDQFLQGLFSATAGKG